MRHHALDNLRAFVVFLVVLVHASLSYMAYAPTWWYVLDPQRSLFFTCLVLIVDVPIMLIMFFLSGYFTYPSLSRRGPGAFMGDKLKRIGIPWVFGVFVLAPPTAYMILYSRHVPISLGTFWRTDFWGESFQQSVYWYLGVLLLLFALTALLFATNHRFASWRAMTLRPSWRLHLGVILGLTALSLPLSLFSSFDEWSHVYVLVLQPARIPLYVGYFALGIYASQRGWFTEGGYSPNLRRWGLPCLVSGFAYLGWRLTGPLTEQTLSAKAVTALLFNTFCFTALVASIALFRAHLARGGPFWRSQARNSYGVYYLHPLILYPLAFLFVPIPISIFVKACAITLLAHAASWGLSAWVLIRLPGLRRVF